MDRFDPGLDLGHSVIVLVCVVVGLLAVAPVMLQVLCSFAERSWSGRLPGAIVHSRRSG